MTRDELLIWMRRNLPEWPQKPRQLMTIPSTKWEWLGVVCSDGHFVARAQNIETGEIIQRLDFEDNRYYNRFEPCGCSFNELMEDLACE